MKSFTLRFNRSLCGKNGPKGLVRMHWTRRRSYRNNWALEIMAVARTAGVPEIKPKEKRRLEIHQIRTRLFKDLDNLQSSVITFLDASKGTLIWDDAFEYLDWTATQEKGDEPATIVTVWVGE